MTRGRIHTAIIAAVLIAVPLLSQTKELVGYYPSWKWNMPDHFLAPENIPYGKLTVINYAFFYPGPDGSLIGRDTAGDALILGRPTAEGTVDEQGRSRLTDQAHRHGVRVLLSVGGWEDSGNFPAVSSTPSTRETFAHSCLRQIRTFGFDGIDIDWEYPGYTDHNGTPQDRENFTLLLRTLSDSLTALGRKNGRHLFLTAAMPAFESALKNYDIDSIAVLLDYLNIMTYDFNGPWSPLSGHNAPLFASSAADSLANVDAAFNLYTRTHKVPAAKINLGVPFYGHAFANCASLNARHAGVDTVGFPGQGAFYYDIASRLKECTRYWDEKAKVPFLICAKTHTFVSYDDPESVALKAGYVLDKNARGLIIWEVTGDRMPDGSTPLLDAIWSTWKSSPVK